LGPLSAPDCKVTKLARQPSASGSGSPVRLAFGEKGERAIAQLGVDYERAPVPLHFYVADYFDLTEQDFRVLLTFGKLDTPSRDRLRNKIEISFPTFMFVRQLWASSRDFHDTMGKFVATAGLTATAPGGVNNVATDKVQTLASNNVLMVLSAGDCMMDFYYVSIKDLYASSLQRRDKNVGIDAVARVICSPALLLGFLDACAPLASKLDERLKQQDQEVVA
jgi:hypothetical protein